ncbi:MAG: transcription termination factor NusA [Arenicellales bacterium]|jgi:N utilization substance protein A|nr:transcription termination factor NusA [Arenicellales bacterium]MDC1097526.1 transcription termination factor NusA [Gammaproteobacteria bacterium]
MTKDDVLMMADVLSREKDIDRGIVFEAIEAALATATRKRNREDIEVRVEIDRNTGDYKAFRQWEIVEDDAAVESPARQMTFAAAEISYPDDTHEMGGFVEEPLETVAAFGRIEAQAAKQVISQKVREAERARVYEDFKDRIGQMVQGVVKRVGNREAIIDLEGVEASLPRSNWIDREVLRSGDRVKSILGEVRTEPRGPQLILDRRCPELVVKLFQLEVPEVGQGVIEILGAARDPGSRAKIAVRSQDSRIDPVGACVGIRGARVQSVSNELNLERIDIITWADNPAEFVIKALQPAEVESIIVDEDSHSMDVVVDEQQQSLAIGRGGQNVRLASDLSGWTLNIMTDEAAAEKAEQEAQQASERLMTQLNIDAEVAGVLVEEGFVTPEEVAYVPVQELLDVEGFDQDLVDQLRARARDFLDIREIAEAENLRPEPDLLAMDGMDEETATLFASKGIRSMEDLAECATDELTELTGIEEERAAALIMTARIPWFEEPVSENQSVEA